MRAIYQLQLTGPKSSVFPPKLCTAADVYMDYLLEHLYGSGYDPELAGVHDDLHDLLHHADLFGNTIDEVVYDSSTRVLSAGMQAISVVGITKFLTEVDGWWTLIMYPIHVLN